MQTGGEAVDGAGKVGEVFQRAIEGIRSRYFVQYAAPPAEAGSFRRIRVELTPSAKRRHADAILKAREGYYATPRQYPPAPTSGITCSPTLKGSKRWS